MHKWFLAAFALSVGWFLPGADAGKKGGGETKEALQAFQEFIGNWKGTANEKKLGTIADMLFSADGAINAVMLNVGGFLGIGVKHIAIPVSAITITQKNNKSWLTMNTTKELLKKAVAYKFDKATGLWDQI